MTTAAPLVVFAYDFPHRKTQDILVRLFLEGIPVNAVIAAPRVDLGIPSPSVRTKIRMGGLVPPLLVADRIGADYLVMAHEGEEIEGFLRDLRPQIGVIGGSRILKKPVIDSFSIGIINFHPGLIPEVRGLDALLWAVHAGVELGVTAHLIDERVDAGDVLLKRTIEVKGDDTVFDLSERLYSTQLDLLKPAIDAALQRDSIKVSYAGHSYNRKMPPDLEAETLEKLSDYIRIHAQ